MIADRPIAGDTLVRARSFEIGRGQQVEANVERRQVIPSGKARLEQHDRARRLGNDLAVQLDSHMTRAPQRVNSGVGVSGMNGDFLVLFVPAVHRMPVERNVAGKIADARRVMARLGQLIGRHVVPRVVVVFPDEQRVRRVDNRFTSAHDTQPFVRWQKPRRRNKLRHTQVTPPPSPTFQDL